MCASSASKACSCKLNVLTKMASRPCDLVGAGSDNINNVPSSKQQMMDEIKNYCGITKPDADPWIVSPYFG